jgi:hypothetical protein
MLIISMTNLRGKNDGILWITTILDTELLRHLSNQTTDETPAARHLMHLLWIGKRKARSQEEALLYQV